MKHDVSFHKLMDYLKQEQQQSPRLNNFGYGDIVYFVNDSGTTTTYPFLFVTPINIAYAENTTTYSLQMIFADIVNTDLSNEIDVVSDMSLEARRFLSVVKRGFLDDKIDVILPSQATSFFERFNDHVGGVVLNADIVVFEDINACELYPEPAPYCNQIDIVSNSISGLTGTYDLVYSGSGQPLIGYIDDSVSPYTFKCGQHPNGNNYVVFTGGNAGNMIARSVAYNFFRLFRNTTNTTCDANIGTPSTIQQATPYNTFTYGGNIYPDAPFAGLITTFNYVNCPY